MFGILGLTDGAVWIDKRSCVLEKRTQTLRDRTGLNKTAVYLGWMTIKQEYKTKGDLDFH